MSTEFQEHEQPDWEPLRKHVGATCERELCEDPDKCPMSSWMWMYRRDGKEFYKHRDTREYLVLSSEMQPDVDRETLHVH